jgi:hypothetical protein
MHRWVSSGLGLVLLALAAGVWWLAAERRSSVASVAPDPGSSGASSGSSSALTVVREDQDRERMAVSREAEADNATGAPADEHEPPEPPEPPPEPSVRIRAVDGITGAGLPGARVSWVSAEETARMQGLLADREELDFEALVSASANFPIADARGEVELPAESATVVARWRNKLGIEPLHELDSGLIRLWAEYALELKVVDASGAPRIGIPVQLPERSQSTCPTTAARCRVAARASTWSSWAKRCGCA